MSWADNFRDTRPSCWVAQCQLWPFWNFAKEKKQQDLQEDLKLLPIPKKGGTALEVLTFCLEKLVKLVFSISSKLGLHIPIRHGRTGSQNFGNNGEFDQRMITSKLITMVGISLGPVIPDFSGLPPSSGTLEHHPASPCSWPLLLSPPSSQDFLKPQLSTSDFPSLLP